mgnify:CR=1 FL=1|jgi:hypothetical protein
MKNQGTDTDVCDKELSGILLAISIVSKRLAEKLKGGCVDDEGA